MIGGLIAYPEYIDSYSPWLGKCPAHWMVVRLGSLLRERGENNERGEITQVLSVMKDRGVIPYEEKGRIGNKKSEDTRRYKIVRAEDIVVNCMNVIIGSVGLSKYTGCLSPVYYVLTRRELGNNPHYLNLVFQTKPFQRSLVRIGNGILAHRMRIPMELLKCEPLPCPPIEEQNAIVKFVDYATGKIDRAIRAKKKLIALLNEQKQAIIHRAVTRGLDPNVSLKPSGIPWLGNIPNHWKTLRGKDLFREVDQRSRTGSEELLSVSHITGVTPRSQKNITMFKAASYVGSKLCLPGDLVINTMWAWMGALAISGYEGIVSPSYGVYRPKPHSELTGEYANYLLRTAMYVGEYTVRSTGVTASRLRLYPEKFLRMPILLPPEAEQKIIAQDISAKTMGLDEAIFSARREIDLLVEYRTRVIADVVTGKLDVREASSQLPDEVDAGGVELSGADTDEEVEIPEDEEALA